MSDLIQWPFMRIQTAGVGNPRFVSDIEAANQAVITAILSILDLDSTDFAILSGLDFTPGTPNTYTSGYFYLNGQIYYQASTVTEGQYLQGTQIPIMSNAFQDGISRNIYQTNTGNTSATGGAGFSPQFSGSMNAYRLGLSNLQQAYGSQNPNLVLAGPASGGAALAAFRALVNADLPPSGVTAGTYNNVAVNAQGIVTVGSNVSVAPKVTTFSNSGTYTIIVTDQTVIGDAGGFSNILQLPTAASSFSGSSGNGTGRIIYLKGINNASDTVTIAPNGSDTIDGVGGNIVLGTKEGLVLQACSATGWVCLSKF